MLLSETYARVRSGIVAFVPSNPDKLRAGSLPHEFIFGTGFIVGDSLVATNAHVAEVFREFPTSVDGVYDVSILLFIRQPQGMLNLKVSVVKTCIVSGMGEPTGAYYGPKPDLALLSVNCKGLSDYAFAINSEPAEEGVAIATSGFPMGSVLLHLEGQLDHIAPTLQSGIVSAVLPFPKAKPHGYLANIMVQEGASGSPVFLPDSGEVVGVVCSRRLDHGEVLLKLPKPIYVTVPTNFSHVVPSHFLQLIVDEWAEDLMKFIPGDAPNIADVLDAIPKKPEQSFTQGVYEHKSQGVQTNWL